MNSIIVIVAEIGQICSSKKQNEKLPIEQYYPACKLQLILMCIVFKVLVDQWLTEFISFGCGMIQFSKWVNVARRSISLSKCYMIIPIT